MESKIFVGDCRKVLPTKIPDRKIHCCVTSPPYFGLRDYGEDGQIGQESTPEEYIENMVVVFREVWRVLRDDGTLWLNLGDTHRKKQLLGIPWRVALALQSDGWILRSDIIWAKPNPMPESVTDRCTKSHEYLFLLTKSNQYYFDAEAIKDDSVRAGEWNNTTEQHNEYAMHRCIQVGPTRNRRSVWTIAPKPFRGAHFAVMPPALVEPCILAGCPYGGNVLDPFFGAGTVGLVAHKFSRKYVGIELNPEYAKMAQRRIDRSPGPGFGLLGR